MRSTTPPVSSSCYAQPTTAAIGRGWRSGWSCIDRALEISARLPASATHLRVLNQRRWQLNSLGRYAEGAAVARTAVEVATEFGDRRLLREQLIGLAWHEGLERGVSPTLELLARGRALLPDDGDPLGDIRSAVIATDMLLLHGGALDDVEEAARPGMRVARGWGIDNETSMRLRANLATARLRAGRVTEAEAVVGVAMDEPPDPDRWTTHAVRAAVDVRRGHVDAAADRIHAILRDVLVHDEIDLDILVVAADVDFWRGKAHVMMPRVLRDLDVTVDVSPVRIVCPALVVAARGVAEEAGNPSGAPLSSVLDLLSRASLGGRALGDPHIRAHIAAASAELARATREDRTSAWADAAALWDRLARPHDAAYCRWRGAQAALREGRAPLAARLLTRAAADAHEHVPLHRAIRATVAGGR